MRLQADVSSSCYELLPDSIPIRVSHLKATLRCHSVATPAEVCVQGPI